MMKKYSFLFNKKTFILIFVLFQITFVHANQNKNWIIAAQKFTFFGNESEQVKEGISRMFPERILEVISQNSFRNIYENEEYERQLYSLKTEITSLFLQLSAEIKRRDSLVLNDYTNKELQKKILEEEKQLTDIKNKIDENLKKQKEIHAKIIDEELNSQIALNSANEPLIEKIEVYRNDCKSLYQIPDNIEYFSYDNRNLEKDIVNNGINCLISGQIKAYGEYLSVTVELYNYPGGKKIASVTEYGTLDEADFLSEMIVHKLSPVVTNSFPIHLNFFSNIPLEEISIYVDNVLQNNIKDTLTIDSGIHHLEFVSKDFVTENLNYYFDGNNTYNININLYKKNNANIEFNVDVPEDGFIYTNGQIFQNSLEINGKPVLGQIYSPDKINEFFIINPDLIQNDNVLTMNAKFFDKNEYIEKRRRWMYTSYSVLISSLIPTFYLNGQADSYKYANSFGYLKTAQDYETAQNWIIASNVSTGISITCGLWFIYELIRYLYAANSVLPTEVTQSK